MTTLVTNCKHCHRVFRSSGAVEICNVCLQSDGGKIRQAYRLLQSSAMTTGGMHIEDVASNVGAAAEDVLEWYMANKLGTAAQFLIFACQGCKKTVRERDRQGRYCIACSKETSEKAGVTVKSTQQLELEAEQQQLFRQQEMAKQYNAKQGKPATLYKAPSKKGFGEPSRFGMKK
jgi:hypothetical protein